MAGKESGQTKVRQSATATTWSATFTRSSCTAVRDGELRSTPYDLRRILQFKAAPGCAHLSCRSFGFCVIEPVASATATGSAGQPDQALNGDPQFSKSIGNSSENQSVVSDQNRSSGSSSVTSDGRACPISSTGAAQRSSGDNQELFMQFLDEHTTSESLDERDHDQSGAGTSTDNVFRPSGLRCLGQETNPFTLEEQEELSPLATRKETINVQRTKRVSFLDATPRLVPFSRIAGNAKTTSENGDRSQSESTENPSPHGDGNTFIDSSRQALEIREDDAAQAGNLRPAILDSERLANSLPDQQSANSVYPTTRPANDPFRDVYEQAEDGEAGNTPLNSDNSDGEQQSGDETIKQLESTGKSTAATSSESERNKVKRKRSTSIISEKPTNQTSPPKAAADETVTNATGAGVLHHYRIPKVVVQQPDATARNAEAILTELLKKGTVSHEDIRAIITATPDPRSTGQSSWLGSIPPMNTTRSDSRVGQQQPLQNWPQSSISVGDQPRSPKEILNATFDPSKANKVWISTVSPEQTGEINYIEFQMANMRNAPTSDREKIAEFVSLARAGSCEQLKASIARMFSTNANPTNFAAFLSELKRMREVNPTDLVNEELAKRRMYEQNYMRLYSELRAMVPPEHLSEDEICNMIRLRLPEPIQNGLASQLALIKSLGMSLTPMNAISAAETLRQACQASQRPDKKRQHSGDQATPSKRREPENRIASKTPVPTKESPPAGESTKPRQTAKFGDADWQCKHHWYLKEKARNCTNPEKCAFTKMKVNTVTTQAAGGQGSSKSTPPSKAKPKNK